MDPLSISMAASSISKLVFSISTTLYSFIAAVQNIDETIRALCTEVSSLAGVLDAITISLQRYPSMTLSTQDLNTYEL